MATLAPLRRFLYVLFEHVALVAFVVMLGSSLLQVFFRYVMNSPLMWTEELARLMCVLATYFGSVVALIAREHIRVDLIDTLLPATGRRLLALAVDVLVAWFLVAVVIGCWLMMQATWTTFTATMDWFRTGYLYLAVGIAASTMILVLVMDVIEHVLALTRPRAVIGR